MAYNNSRNPLRILQKRIGKKIGIRLKDGTQYTGNLREYDNYMNIIISSVSEVDNDSETNSYEQLFVRGNNILFIEPEIEK